MTDDELGKLSTFELEMHPNQPEVEAELGDRFNAYTHGKPGHSPLLSRRQVRAVLGPLLHKPYPETSEHSGSDITEAEWDANCVVHTCARALLTLPPEDPSPLEDES